MRRRILWLTFWVTVAIWFGQGCAPHNESNRLRGMDVIPVLAMNEQPTVFTGERSVTGVDRSDWPALRAGFALDDTNTDPIYWRPLLLRKYQGPRITGGFPTVESAMELADDRRTRRGQYLEIAIEPVRQLISVFIMPVRMVLHNPVGGSLNGSTGDYEIVPPAADIRLFPGAPSEGGGDGNGHAANSAGK